MGRRRGRQSPEVDQNEENRCIFHGRKRLSWVSRSFRAHLRNLLSVGLAESDGETILSPATGGTA